MNATTWSDSAARVRTRMGRYVRRLLWLGRDAILRFWWPSLLVVGGGFGSLSSLVGALALAAVYANALAKGTTVQLLGAAHDARTSLVLLAEASGLVLVALLVSGILTYVSAVASLVLRRRYEEFATARAFDVLRTAPVHWKGQAGGAPDATDLVRLVRTDTALLGRAAQMLVNSIMPAITCVLAAGTLVYLEPVSTLIIAVITLVSGVFLYRASVQASDASRRMEELQISAGREFRHHLNALRDAASTDAPPNLVWRGAGDVKDYLDALYTSIRMMERGRLVSNIALAVSLCVVIVTMGMSILRHGTGWDRLLIYLFALRHGLVNLRTVTTLITGMNRFYPNLRRHHAFLARGSAPAASDATSRRLAPARRIAVLSPLPANRYTAGVIAEWLVGPDAAAEALADARLVPMPPSTYGVPMTVADVTAADAATLERAGRHGLPNVRLDQPAAEVDRPTLCGLGLLAALPAAERWVLIDGAVVDRLPGALTLTELSPGAGTVVVVATPDVELALGIEPDRVVVTDGASVLGDGDRAWFETVGRDLVHVVRPAADDDASALDHEEHLLEM